jgi:hypothetical protein
MIPMVTEDPSPDDSEYPRALNSKVMKLRIFSQSTMIYVIEECFVYNNKYEIGPYIQRETMTANIVCKPSKKVTKGVKCESFATLLSQVVAKFTSSKGM